MKNRIARLCVLLAVVPCVSLEPQQSPTLAEVLSHTQEQAGPATGKYSTPFLVVTVLPISGGECDVELATNGMLYSVYGQIDDGWCDHLPTLHSLVWGQVRHSRLATFLRQSNTANVQSDYVDLVYSGGNHPGIAHYIIATAQAIDANWGHDTVLAPESQILRQLSTPGSLTDQIKANSEAAKSSEAALAAGPSTPQAEQELINSGRASLCMVTTSPAGAEILVDGKRAGKTPMAFVLFRLDTERVITIRLSGYNTIEKKISPDGKEVTLNLTLEPEQTQ